MGGRSILEGSRRCGVASKAASAAQPGSREFIAAGLMVRDTHHKSPALPRELRFRARLNEFGHSSHRL